MCRTYGTLVLRIVFFYQYFVPTAQFQNAIILSLFCLTLDRQGIYPGVGNTRSQKVRPQKLQKATALHAPQIPRNFLANIYS